MKRIAKLLISTFAAAALLGSAAVSADEVVDLGYELDPEMQVEVETVPVYLNLEFPDGNAGMYGGDFPIDGSASAADVVEYLLADRELVGLEDGYITSIDGIEAGAYGENYGWLYAVNYYFPNAFGQYERFIAIPTVSMADFPITAPCQIILYYGDFDDNFAGFTFTEDGNVKLVQYTPVYNENFELTAFEESALADGCISFTETFMAEDGTESRGETFVFTADENGVTELDIDLTQLKNGMYLGTIGAQETLTVDGVEVSISTVVRLTDYFEVDVHPTEEELLRRKMELMLVAMH